MDKSIPIKILLWLTILISINIASAEPIISVVEDTNDVLVLSVANSLGPNNEQIEYAKWNLLNNTDSSMVKQGIRPTPPERGLEYRITTHDLEDGDYMVWVIIVYEGGYVDYVYAYFTVLDNRFEELRYFNTQPEKQKETIKVEINSDKLPGFTAMFAIAGLLAVAYLIYREREE